MFFWRGMIRIRWLLTGILCILCSTYLWAEIGTISLQAVLQNQSGYLTGEQEVIFRIYDRTGENYEWEETHTILFSTGRLVQVLGRITPIDFDHLNIEGAKIGVFIGEDSLYIPLTPVPSAASSLRVSSTMARQVTGSIEKP